MKNLNRFCSMLIKTSKQPILTSSRTALPKTSEPKSEKAPQAPTDRVESTPSAQAERITRFVEEKKLQGAQALKQMSSLMAGQLVGMTVGSMVFAPLALSMGNLYIATGGAALTGAAMALGASALAKKDFSKLTRSKVGDAYAGVGAVANSLPKIAYPTLVGASEAKKAVFYNALDNLPLSGVTSAPTVDVVTGLEAVGASGLATPLFSHNRIFLDVDQMNISDNWASEVLTHEIGHTYDFSVGVGPIGSRNFRGGGFGSEPFISRYAHTNRMEDYAESYAHFHLEPEKLQQVAPEKFVALESSQAPGLVDKALDRPSVRKAGRQIGEAFEAAPRLRNVLALGASLVAPFQLYRGAAEYEKGLQSDDVEARVNGKLSMASGAALLGPGTAPLSLLFTAGQMVTNQQLANGSITPEQAEKRADTALAVATGPFGSIASSVSSELEGAGLLISNDKKLMNDAKLAFSPMGAKKTLAKMGGGFALGAAAGGILLPLITGGSAHALVGAAATGTWMGGLVGATAGLGLDVLRPTKSPDFFGLKQQDPQGLTGEDKKLLAKLGASSVVGGLGGAVGGYFGGQMIGQLIGSTLAGSAGGVTGAALGSYLGVLGGSLAGAKGGAKLGGKWAGLQAKSQPPKDPKS